MELVASTLVADRPLRIVICEDEALTALHLQVALSALGYDVVAQASDGEKSIHFARELRPDVILMDVNMPGTNGIDALRQIMEEAPTTVVMLTAYSDPEVVQRALSAGASGYLVKPFRDEQLAPMLSVARTRFLELHRERLAARVAAAQATRQVNDTLHRAVGLREEMQRERAVARALAENFLCPAPALSGVKIETVYEPASAATLIGGDYFDFIPLPDDRLGLVVADVCGKGLPAASLTAVCRHTLRAYALEDPAPETILRRLNRALCSQTSEECAFVTLVYGVIDLVTFDFVYANAGHPSPVLCAPEARSCISLDATGGLLGVEPGWEWATAQVRILPGGALTLFTDGITEAHRGSEQFGSRRVEAALRRLLGENSPDLALGLKEQARTFARGELHDDVAVVVVRRPAPG